MTELHRSASADVRRLPRVRRVISRVLYAVGPLILLLLLWHFLASQAQSLFFPTPLAIWDNSMRLFFSGGPETAFLTTKVTTDIVQSLWRMLLGFVIGSCAGVLFGVAVGRSIALKRLSDPVVEFLRSIPATATLPLFIILLGAGDGMRVAFIAYAVLWFVLINTASGVSAIHPTVLDLGRVFRLPKWKVLVQIIVPAALPKIFAGLRIGSTVAVLSAIVSEFMLATNGIGHQLIISQAEFLMTNIWSWVVVLALVGYLINTIMEFIERRTLAWDRLVQGAS